MARTAPTDYEREAWDRGLSRVVGVDEAGCGPLAGPVVAAAVALEPGQRLDGVFDSKALSRKQREELAREIVFRQFIAWGYREYVDVNRAAWEFNRDRPDGTPPFRVLGINDSPQWHHVKTLADRDDPEIMRKVWEGMGEQRWGPVILAAVATPADAGG